MVEWKLALGYGFRENSILFDYLERIPQFGLELSGKLAIH